MTLSTSIIITSVALALLQYFENSSQARVAHARQKLRDNFAVLLKKLKDLLPEESQDPTNIRGRYDELVNFNAKRAGLLLIALFVVFGLVVLLHAVHTLASLDGLAETIQDILAKGISYVRVVLDIGLVVIVILAGVHLYQKNGDATKYQRDVEESIEKAKAAVELAEAAVRHNQE